MEILEGFRKKPVTPALSFNHAGSLKWRNQVDVVKCAKQVMIRWMQLHCSQTPSPWIPVSLSYVKNVCHTETIWVCYKVVADQEQSNGRSPSGRAYWVCMAPVGQAASARKALLPLPQWAGALSHHRALHILATVGKPGEESEFPVLLLTGHAHSCFIQDDGQCPFSKEQVKAKHISLKAWFDISANLF